jgi:hypothetical protein
MRPELIQTFTMIRPNGEPVTIHEWQTYHLVSGGVQGSDEWVPDQTNRLTTDDGMTIDGGEVGNSYWITMTGEKLTRPARNLEGP